MDKRTKAYKDSIKKKEDNVYSFDVQETLTPKIKNKAPKGLGDVVESITKATGIKKLVEAFTPEGEDCGCDKRKKGLNLSLELGRHKVLRCLSETQFKEYGAYIKERTLTFERVQVKFLTDLYAHVFAIQYNPNDFCANCGGSAKRLSAIQKKLDKVHESYGSK
jgi:hypothetical protein